MSDDGWSRDVENPDPGPDDGGDGSPEKIGTKEWKISGATRR